MEELRNRPEVRFKEFEENWEIKNLGEIATFSKGRGYSKNDLKSTGTPIVLYGRLYTNYETSISSVNTFAELKDKSVLSKGHEVIVPASGETAEDIARASAILEPNIIIGSDLHIIYTDKIDPVFLSLLISHGNSNKELSRLAQGKSVVHLGVNDLRNLIIDYPNDKEQSQIGTFFQHLDSLITRHQQKYTKLLTFKKAMLEKMFPKAGADVPEIRFKGFDGKWDEMKLGDIGSVAMNKRIFKNQTSEKEEIPFYKIGTFGGIADAFISRELFEEYKSKYSYPKKGDILISASGSIGRIVQYSGADEYFQDSNIVWLVHDGSVKNCFLKYFYSVVKWEGLEGSTIKRLYNKNILMTKISLPTIAEQTKIGSFFQQLDNLIASQKIQIEKLQNLKQALLNKMFV